MRRSRLDTALAQRLTSCSPHGSSIRAERFNCLSERPALNGVFCLTDDPELFDLKLLPLTLFPVMTDYEQTYGRDIEGETFYDQVEKGELEVIENTAHRFECKSLGSEYSLTEVARADFNGDGTEDILFRESGRCHRRDTPRLQPSHLDPGIE